MKHLSVIFYLALLGGCFSDCGYVEEKEYAESLSQKELANLYTEVSDLAEGVSAYEPMRAKSSVENSNRELAKLEFKFLELERNYARIILGGCFDDKASLLFEGFKEGEKSIDLVSGEHSSFERKTIWKSSK